MLCYRCGGHVKDGLEKCPSCGQQFALGLKPGPIAGFGAGSRRHRVAVEGAPCKPGDAIAGRFVVKDGLGAGPLGWVFRALDRESGEQVALKILSPRFLQLPEERSTFSAQMERVLAVDHPNTARVLAAGIDGDKPWVASQLLEGLTLRRIMDLRRQKGQGFALHEVEPIVAQIASALEAAPFAHGDLKPDNVLVLPDLLKLTDFGLGLCLPRAPFVAAQRAGGVHRYLAPELQAGERPDGRSDVFALGALLGELLAGAPFEPAMDLRGKLSSLPRGVEQVFARAVSPRGADRFVTAGQLAGELAEALDGSSDETRGREGEAGDVEDDVEDDVVDDVVIEYAQTDPRIRLARALEMQDQQLAAARARRESAAAAASLPAAPPIPQVAAPVEPPRAAKLTGEEPTQQLPLVSRELPPLQLAPPLALPPLSTPPPLSLPPLAPPVLSPPVPARAPSTPPVATPAPLARNAPSAEEVARVAASVGVEPGLLTAETAVKAAPTAPAGRAEQAGAPAAAPAGVTPAPAPRELALPSTPAAPPAPAPLPLAAAAAQGAPAIAAEAPPAAPAQAGLPDTAEGERDGADSAAGGKGRKRRGKRGRKDEVRRRPQRDPEWAAGAGTSAPAPTGSAATAIGAQTPAFEPLPSATLEEVARAIEGKPAAATGQRAAEVVPTRPPARATPSFGALAAAERRPPAPLVALGAVAMIGFAVWGWGRFTASEPNVEPATEAAPKAEAKPAPNPAGATPTEMTEPGPAAPAEAPRTADAARQPEARTAPVAPRPAQEPKLAPLPDPEPRQPEPRPAPARAAAAVEPARDTAEKSGKPKKKSFLERLRERREARRKAQEEALAEAASKRAPPAAPAAQTAPPSAAPASPPAAPAAAAAVPPRAATPAPGSAAAPAPASPPQGGAIAGLEDGDSLVASKVRKPVALAAAPASSANDAACPPGMKLIPGGPAHVGTDASDDLRNFGDRPAATVEVKAFCVDVFEYPNKPGQLPKIAAAFGEADAACQREGKRLCTEDEWEKSCRGPQNLRFPYGPNFDPDACNTQDKATNPRKITVVGIYGSCKSGYGVFDLSGNAAEWTTSAFEAGAAEKAVKGGSATRPGFDDRCSSRRRLAAGAHDVNVGFRCCADGR